MAKRKFDPTGNLYAIGVAMIASEMTVDQWWEVDGYDHGELVRWFGRDALRRGVENARRAGLVLPVEVEALYPEEAA